MNRNEYRSRRPSVTGTDKVVFPKSSGFTLIELLMAMAIGLVVSNIALVSFVATQKYIQRIETLSAKSDAAQSMILWCITKQGSEDKYPQGSQFRYIGGKVSPTPTEICTLGLYDCTTATPVLIAGNTLYVPVTGN